MDFISAHAETRPLRHEARNTAYIGQRHQASSIYLTVLTAPTTIYIPNKSQNHSKLKLVDTHGQHMDPLSHSTDQKISKFIKKVCLLPLHMDPIA